MIKILKVFTIELFHNSKTCVVKPLSTIQLFYNSKT